MGYKTEKKIPSIILSVFIVLLILVGTIVPAYAAPTQDMMVTDSGEMLSDREEQEVSEMLYSINRQTGIEYLVYTIKSLNGEDIETCANRLFRTAGLGDKEKDNGLLLLISYDDRKFRLEVGYGLEGDIPDTQAANIINTMTPYFKEGNYGDGVKAAAVSESIRESQCQSRMRPENSGEGTMQNPSAWLPNGAGRKGLAALIAG